MGPGTVNLKDERRNEQVSEGGTRPSTLVARFTQGLLGFQSISSSLSPVRSNNIHFARYSGLCIRWLQLGLPLLRQQSFSSWRSPLLKCQSLKLCCSWVTHAEPTYGGHTPPGFFSGIKKQTAIFGWPQYPRRASRLLAQSSQGSCDIKGKVFHSSKFVSETPRKALNFAVS